MIAALVIIPIVATLLWLLSIRPYCRRNGKGFTPGATLGVAFWVDWQEAKEISKAKGDQGMITICRLVFWLHVLAIAMAATAVFDL